MSQNITLQGATYSNVPSVSLPKQGGGTASFTDVTDTTASASDVASGKYFYTAAGVRTEGTSSGGGGGDGYVWQDGNGYVHLSDEQGTQTIIDPLSVSNNGTYTAATGHAYSPVTVSVSGGSGLVYETGTYIPANDINEPTISFANVHNKRPFSVSIEDMDFEDTTPSADSMLAWSIYSFYDAYGVVFNFSNMPNYSRTMFCYKTSSSCTWSGYTQTQFDTGSTSSLDYFLTNTGFTAYVGVTARYFRQGRHYKWIAVWPE